MTSGVKPRRLHDRIWENVYVNLDGCWLWIGGVNHAGYGVIRVGGRYGRNYLIHRLLDELRNGPIPDGICVLHHCDTPRCVRPDHLWRGTQAENIADMDQKDRGRRHYSTTRKLTDDQILQILESTESSYALASKLPVTARTIRRIRQTHPFTLGRKPVDE